MSTAVAVLMYHQYDVYDFDYLYQDLYEQLLHHISSRSPLQYLMFSAGVQTLQKESHDIESHSMNHIPLDDLSQQQLNYEIGQSKQCIIDHSVNTNINNKDVPIFAYPFDIGRNNITVINTVAKYYQLGRTGDKPLAFLNCDLSLEDKKMAVLSQVIMPMETAGLDLQRTLLAATTIILIWLVLRTTTNLEL